MKQFGGLVYIVLVSFWVISAETDDTRTFIVRVQSDLKPSVFSDVEQWYSATLRSLDANTLSSSDEPGTRPKSRDFIHLYKTVFHGFSTRLTPRQAEELKSRHGVLLVLQDRMHQIQTTRSVQFLGLGPTNPAGILAESDSGSNIIIGIFDTGIAPEHPSFRDEGLGPVPSGWKGECTEGEKFTKELCNKKVIGARYFTAGYEASIGRINNTSSLKSARDTDGHGTHTASTAAGRAVANASLFGYARGVAVGVAPKARIAAYKMCWARGCMDSDILAAFDKAVEDGVNVISMSVGGGTVPYHLDPIAIGSFAAMERGILVSASAGNDGPGRMTVTNVAPWITTVGASTIDRKFPADLVLEDGTRITGASLYSGDPLPEKAYLPLVYAGNVSVARTGIRQRGAFSAATCQPGSLDKELASGKIVVCERGGIARVAKGQVVKDAGGAGVIIANVAPLGEGLIADPHVMPGLAVTESDGYKIRAYITSSTSPKATMVFRGTQLGAKPAPVLASFSARGPSIDSVYILKPDIIAPGVDILAAWPNDVAPTEVLADVRRTEFNIASGTSMSCPHVSGLAALLKGAHPDWSPAMIRSALMTTAYVTDADGKALLDERNYDVSSAWGFGAGHVDPSRAVDPGLVYDLTADDYVNFLCASNYSRQDIRLIARRPWRCVPKQLQPWNINYPAISVAFDEPSTSKSMEVVVERTAMHVSDVASTYTATVVNPKGARVTVMPPRMGFTERGQKQRFLVKIMAEEKAEVLPGNMATEFGKLTWSDGKHNVVSPIVVVWQRPF